MEVGGQEVVEVPVKKISKLSNISSFLSPPLSIFIFFGVRIGKFVCNLKGGKLIRDRRDAIRGRNSRTISTNTRSFSSGDQEKP